MQQYFLDQKLSDRIEFNQEQSHHIMNVMRMKPQTMVRVVDADHQVAFVRIAYENKKVIGILDEICVDDHESSVKITLGMALIKKDKWEWVLQKATEVGAYEIIPFASERSVVKIQEEKNEKKLNRWQKIVLEAAEQSKRDICPRVHEVVTFREICQCKADLKLIAYENADYIAANLGKVLQNNPNVHSIFILIGPEGGFSENEVRKAQEQGFVCVSLGKRILRAETAAISLLSMLDYHYEILREDEYVR